MIKRKEIRGLIFYVRKPETVLLSYNDDWLDAFIKYAPVNFDLCNLAEKRSWLSIIHKLRKYELIILLHSTNSNSNYVHFVLRKALQHRKGKIILFIGNEYKLMPQKMKLIRDLNADFVASQLPQDTAEWLYSETRAKVLSVPHALNPNVFKPEIHHRDRQIDISDRYAEYPWYLGDRERAEIHEFFLEKRTTLRLDISSASKDRFDRYGWARFLNYSKGTISTEAGASFLERDDKTRLKVNKYMKDHPEITFDELYIKFFKKYEIPISGKLVSPRHFDAIGTKTCQIMFPGRFNDILEADEHYIALNRDFSNIDDVIGRFQDTGYRQEIVDRTYEYVMDRHTHRHRIEHLLMCVGV